MGVGTDGCTVETVVSNGPEVRSMIRRMSGHVTGQIVELNRGQYMP